MQTSGVRHFSVPLQVVIDSRMLTGNERYISFQGLYHLADLASLKACTFESSRASADTLNAVSRLTRLTSVEVCCFCDLGFPF